MKFINKKLRYYMHKFRYKKLDNNDVNNLINKIDKFKIIKLIMN